MGYATLEQRRAYEAAHREQIRERQRRLRRERYAGTCEVCGAATDGSNGAAKAPDRCHRHPRTRWTPETITTAIQEWAHRYGRPPGAADWNPAQAAAYGQHERVERFYADDCWPHTSHVVKVMGSWSAAITAAGFPPNRVGRPRKTAA